MPVRSAVLTLLAALLLGGAARVSAPTQFVPVIERAYEMGMGLDELVPPVPFHDAPVVVVVHGCCGDRRDLAVLSRSLARRGAVVLAPDVHRYGSGGGWPSSYADVICAVSEARRLADGLPGHHRVALVGWSDGALLGATVSLG